MTAPSTSIVFSKLKNTTFLNTQRNMFSSPYAKILHDPECQSRCCLESFDHPKEGNVNNVEQCPSFTAYYSNESISTLINNKNQFLYYDGTTCNNQVLEFQEENVRNELVMAHSDLHCEAPIKRARYDTSPIKINLVDTRCKQKSYNKGTTKRKRNRTIFSTQQIVLMEGVFKKRPYVSKEERQLLSQRLNITEKAIKIWFQNRRRVTDKRERDQSDSCHSDSTVEEVCYDYNSRLDYIESQIRQNTDEYGFVTLDNKSLTELVRIIDRVLSYSVDCNSLHETRSNDSYLMYEPVSPESLSDDNRENENILKWEPSIPEESLQRLIDIQTVLYS